MVTSVSAEALRRPDRLPRRVSTNLDLALEDVRGRGRAHEQEHKSVAWPPSWNPKLALQEPSWWRIQGRESACHCGRSTPTAVAAPTMKAA